MNYWIKRNHKRQQDTIISFLKGISPLIVIGFNLYSGPTHSLEIFCVNDSFTLSRHGKEWIMRFPTFHIKLDDYDTPEFWRVIKSYVQYYLKPPPIEFVDD